MFTLISLRPLLLTALALGLAPAWAEKADRSKPMTVEADKPGTVDLQRQVVLFNGNVVIAQGTMVIRAERVEIRESPDGYRTATAIGTPAARSAMMKGANIRATYARNRRIRPSAASGRPSVRINAHPVRS